MTQKENKIFVNARFVTQPLTGVQRYAFECCMQMKSENSNIVFLCPKKIQQHEWAMALGTVSIGINEGHIWEQIDLPFFLKNKKDYLLFNPCNTAPLSITRNLITIHDLSFLLYKDNHSFTFSLWYNYLLPRIAKRAKHIFTVSETVKNQILNHYECNTNNISITYNGMAEHLLHHKNMATKEKIILTVGSISKRKNIETLINAFIESDELKEYTLIIIGQQLPVFKTTSLNKHAKIIYKHKVSESDLIKDYQKAEIFVSLSHYEGFGIPILEALNNNCKILCSDIPIYHELFQEYVYFCDHNNSQAVSNAIIKIIQDKNSKPCDKNILNSKYSYSRSGKHILKTIDQLFK